MASIRVRRVAGAPVVAIRVWLQGGTTLETRQGQAWVSGRLLTEGTFRRDWRRIAEDAETRGASLGADAGYEAQGLAIDALADDWELALDWAAELVRSSTFSEDRCRWIAAQTAADLVELADHPDVRTSWAFSRQLYGSTARGRPVQGSVESLEALTGEQCLGFHNACLERGAIVVVAGDIDEREVEVRARGLFGDLGDPRVPRAGSAVGERQAELRQQIELEDSGQAHWFGGMVTVSRLDSEYWPLALLGVILGAGDGLSGRISHRVRELEGLAYSCSVSTVSAAGREPGCFVVGVGASPESIGEVQRAVTDELGKLIDAGVSSAELRDARSYLLGREPFARETARQWATLMAQSELFGLPLEDRNWVAERWRAVAEEDLLAVARRYLDPSRLRVTVGAGPSPRE